MNKFFFITKLGKMLDDDQKLVQKKVIPAQLPQGFTAEKVTVDAARQVDGFKGLMILYIIIALALKGQKDKLWGQINAAQVIRYIPIYAVDFSAQLTIFFGMVRKIAERDVFGVDDMILLFGIQDWFESEDLTEEAKLGQEKFKGGGFGSSSICKNLNLYISALSVGVVVILVLLAVAIIPKLRQKIKRKLKKERGTSCGMGASDQSYSPS